jgi:hypothetical protein
MRRSSLKPEPLPDQMCERYAADCETGPGAAHRAAALCQVDALAEEVWLMRIKIFPMKVSLASLLCKTLYTETPTLFHDSTYM